MVGKGNPAWKPIDGRGTAPHIKINLKQETKEFLEFEAKIRGVSLSAYCRDVLERHVSNVEMNLNGRQPTGGDVLS